MPFVLLLPLLAQVGVGGALPQAPVAIRAPKREAAAPVIEVNRLQQCLDLVMQRPADGIDMAENWLAAATTMTERAQAKQCKAMGLTRIDGWGEAATLFLAARDDTPANEAGERARLGALGGNALLVSGDMIGAMGALDIAHAEAHKAADHKLNGVIQIDRARALVALGRSDEAAAALDEARAELPDNPQAWLLSATLSRRQGKLADAQRQIERAADLLPIDPEIGLEAGVIAVLSGRDEAARKSWLSVIKAAPGSAFAKTAQGYLDQLGPAAASPPQ